MNTPPQEPVRGGRRHQCGSTGPHRKHAGTQLALGTMDDWTHRPLVNEETIADLREKILERSPSPKVYQADLFVRKTMRPYQQWCEVLPVTDTQSPVCRDPTDQKFIDLAVTGKADYLVTRDDALLEMDDTLSFAVVNDREFRQIMGCQSVHPSPEHPE